MKRSNFDANALLFHHITEKIENTLESQNMNGKIVEKSFDCEAY